MIDIKALRRGLGITQKEMAGIRRIAGVGTLRLLMAEQGLWTLKAVEESTVRMAFAYTMHCRTVRLASKLAQGSLVRSSPMTWEEYLKEHGREKQMAHSMKVVVVNLDLVENGGRLLFPMSEPIAWNIDIDDTAAKVLAKCPSVLESMIQ